MDPHAVCYREHRIRHLGLFQPYESRLSRRLPDQVRCLYRQHDRTRRGYSHRAIPVPAVHCLR